MRAITRVVAAVSVEERFEFLEIRPLKRPT
jgi:hypothetical protein